VHSSADSRPAAHDDETHLAQAQAQALATAGVRRSGDIGADA
jgi:hypothetical protein